MSISNLQRLSIGQIGVDPGLLFLQSNATNVQLQTPGYLNSIAPMAGVSINDGDFLLANASDGAEYYTVSVAKNGIITLHPAGGSSGGFAYINTLWSAQNGNDANDGKSQDSPKLTPAGIQAALIPGVPTVWNIVDGGTYNFNSSFFYMGHLLINAPGATFAWNGAPGGVMFSQNTQGNTSLTINVATINASGTSVIFQGSNPVFVSGPSGYANITNATQIWFDSSALTPVSSAIFNVNTDASGGLFAFRTGGKQVINALELGSSSITSTIPSGSANGVVQINANHFNGSLGGTADFNLTCSRLGNGFSAPTAGIVNFNVARCDFNVTSISGTFTGSVGRTTFVSSPYLFNDNIFLSPLSLNSQPILGEIYDVFFITPSIGGWSFVPGSSGNPVQGSNQHLIITNTTGAITLPDGSGLPAGYRFTASQTVPSGAIVHTSGSDTMSGQNSINPGTTTCYTGIGKMEFINTAQDNGSGGVTWAVVNCFTTSSSFQGKNVAQSIDSPALTFTNLASAGKVDIVTSDRPTSQYQLSNIFLNGVTGTNFSGGGGDRNLHITDGVHEFTLIPAATIQALSNQGWGSVAVPYPALVAINQATAAGSNIYAEYTNGTTDYTAGSVIITLIYERVTF